VLEAVVQKGHEARVLAERVEGTVRNVDFVGAMQTGQQQKGFTLNSIRDAAIPAMPPELKKDFQEEPLELIFNFYF
jgi:hypothetical protein